MSEDIKKGKGLSCYSEFVHNEMSSAFSGYPWDVAIVCYVSMLLLIIITFPEIGRGLRSKLNTDEFVSSRFNLRVFQHADYFDLFKQ